MRIWTVHTDRRDAPPVAGGTAAAPAASVPEAGSDTGRGGAPARPPVLVPERFSWIAFLLPLLWLLWHRLWLAALLYALAAVALGLMLPSGPDFAAAAALHLLLGCHAQDLRRRALTRRGYVLAGVVAAPDEDSAFARLLDRRPALAAPLAGAALA
jgi:hypothetical protein